MDQFPGYEQLLNRLRTHRLRRGWSIQQLADDINRRVSEGIVVSQRTVHNAIEGDVRPRDVTLYKLDQYRQLLDADDAATAEAAVSDRPRRRAAR